VVHGLEKMESNKVSKLRRRSKVDPVRVPKVEAQKN
jgi:hypothetical protein